MAEAHAFRRSPCAPSAPHPAAFSDSHAADERAIFVYDSEVPSFAETALDRLYGSIYSTVGMFRFDGSLSAASTYVAWENGTLVCLLLFRREQNLVTVLNGWIKLDQREMENFAAEIFRRYPAISLIRFNNIRTDLRKSAYPVQRYYAGEDIVATLPGSPEEYLASLGKNMRETVKRYRNRIGRMFPSFRFHVYVDDEVDERQVWELYRLQRARMESKNKVSNVTDGEIVRIIELVKTCGLVTIATIDGRVRAGMVCWRAGQNYFMRTIAHDPEYDEAKLGTLCCYLTICECIARGGKAFHFSPGRVLYKYRFLGVEQHFDSVVLYRSRLRMLVNYDVASRIAIDGGIREIKQWLLDAESRNDRASRTAFRLLTAWRAMKKASGMAAKISAAVAALHPRDAEAAAVALSYSESREANEEIMNRRRAYMPPKGSTVKKGPGSALLGAVVHRHRAASIPHSGKNADECGTPGSGKAAVLQQIGDSLPERGLQSDPVIS